MLKTQQNQPESELLELLDNIDFKQQLQSGEFIVLIKKQPQKNYSTLYLNDCQDNFWLKKIDLPFIHQLKLQLNLKTTTTKFIQCLIKAIKQNSQILLPSIQKSLNPQTNKSLNQSSSYPSLSIKLEIGQGLTMTTQIQLNRNVNRQKDETGHKIILKLFLLQLYESKQTKQNTLLKLLQSAKQSKSDDQSQAHSRNNLQDNKFLKEIFPLSDQKKDPNKQKKHRDLLNPNKPKRKHAGVKFSTPNE